MGIETIAIITAAAATTASSVQSMRTSERAEREQREERDRIAQQARDRQAQLSREAAERAAAEKKAETTGRRAGFGTSSIVRTFQMGFGQSAAATEGPLLSTRGRIFGN